MSAVKDEEVLMPLAPPEVPKYLVHGAAYDFYESIFRSGLLPGGAKGKNFRKHVHLTDRTPNQGEVISGMRTDSEVALWIHARSAAENGLQFWKSRNGVYFCGHIQPLSIAGVEIVAGGEQVPAVDGPPSPRRVVQALIRAPDSNVSHVE